MTFENDNFKLPTVSNLNVDLQSGGKSYCLRRCKESQNWKSKGKSVSSIFANSLLA